MPVGGRHIRHDWQTFVDWEQKSVRTLCGRTSARHLAGIPGVTDQPEVIEIKDIKYFGWCTRCAVIAYDWIGDNMTDRQDYHPYIYPMYEDVARITSPIWTAYQTRQTRLRALR